ncbi:Fe(3+)-hydroxamate ABC transporter permease FhuB [Amorphus coralli]|uniref:Fe(3+)-hydroxamate ABC transporter permease FhuB n=1 Tax=Amorphus coralli TaxID=340680 RepID=UPI000373C060|nr:Fe(3+)-hydroxamate ABC transporter permease FhuB [Amorphus coralli]
MSALRSLSLPLLALALAGPAAALTYLVLAPGLAALGAPAGGFDPARMLLLYSDLPRLTTALVAGAALGLSGTLLQQVLRNPLASPTTLGLSAGANLALALATLYAPGLYMFGRDPVALAGSLVAGLLVLGLSARRGFSPITLVLGGLVVGLYCGALASLLTLLNDRYLASLFIWGSGSLQQQDWSVPLSLAPRVAVLAVIAVLLARPLTLLALPDENTRGLGLNTATVRWGGAAIALALAAVVTAAVGVIGFIGLIAPTVARIAGARTFAARLAWSPLIGALLLWFTDAAVTVLSGPLASFVPTGAITAVFGSPLLFLLLPRLRVVDRRPPADRTVRTVRRVNTPLVLAALAAGLVGLAVAAVLVGRATDGGWDAVTASILPYVLDWRLPRVLAALSAGAMLAAAGVILQRLTANDMASPEVIGVSAGATMGLAVSLVLVAAPSVAMQLGFSFTGAALVLALIFLVAGRSGFAPERIVLAGIALNAMLDAFVGLFAAAGDPRALRLLNWMAGSTYGIELTPALTAFGLSVGLVALACLTMRWLDILPLGTATSQSLGIAVKRTRGLLFTAAVGLTAAATLVVGPLSFVGLMAPHIARELGLKRALPQLLGAALCGAALMVIADFIGRNAHFPYQLPAGLLSALVGAPFLMLLLLKRR